MEYHEAIEKLDADERALLQKWESYLDSTTPRNMGALLCFFCIYYTELSPMENDARYLALLQLFSENTPKEQLIETQAVYTHDRKALNNPLCYAFAYNLDDAAIHIILDATPDHAFDNKISYPRFAGDPFTSILEAALYLSFLSKSTISSIISKTSNLAILERVKSNRKYRQQIQNRIYELNGESPKTYWCLCLRRRRPRPSSDFALQSRPAAPCSSTQQKLLECPGATHAIN